MCFVRGLICGLETCANALDLLAREYQRVRVVLEKQHHVREATPQFLAELVVGELMHVERVGVFS